MSGPRTRPLDVPGTETAPGRTELCAVSDRLRRAAATARSRARALGRPVAAWVTARTQQVDPLDLLAAASRHGLDAVLLAWHGDGFGLVGLGRAWEFDGAGPDRFARAARAWQALMRDSVTVEDEISAGDFAGWLKAGPVLVGGFAFDHDAAAEGVWEGFLASWLVLPRVAVACAGGSTWITLAELVDPGDEAADQDGAGAEECLDIVAGVMGRRPHPGARSRDAMDARGCDAMDARGYDARAATQRTGGIATEELPAPGIWKEKVASAAEAVRKGELRKVVLARSLKVSGAAFDPVQVLRRLRSGYPTCTLFAVARGEGWFVGATPERLVRVRGGEVRAMALAGSAPRGRTVVEDRRLGESLLASAKDRVEHDLVVEQLRQALDGPCESLVVAASPSLLRMPNVQHLCTPVRARLRNHSTVMDLAGRLHPTPAVGGVPHAEALEWIRRHEGLDRGWYAGSVGWMDRAGEGEFSVTIRSAILRGSDAVLYAGCGIVADSDPDLEYEESCLKLRPMLSALGVEPGRGR